MEEAGRMDEWRDGRVKRSKDGRMVDGWSDRWRERRRMERWMGRREDRRKRKWEDEWLFDQSRWKEIFYHPPTHTHTKEAFMGFTPTMYPH